MPITKEITIGYGLTVNTGDYNSVRIDLAMRVALEENDEEDQVIAEYLAYLKDKREEERAAALTRVHG